MTLLAWIIIGAGLACLIAGLVLLLMHLGDEDFELIDRS